MTFANCRPSKEGGKELNSFFVRHLFSEKSFRSLQEEMPIPISSHSAKVFLLSFERVGLLIGKKAQEKCDGLTGPAEIAFYMVC